MLELLTSIACCEIEKAGSSNKHGKQICSIKENFPEPIRNTFTECEIILQRCAFINEKRGDDE